MNKILILGQSSFLGSEFDNFIKNREIDILTLDRKFSTNDIMSLDDKEFCNKYFRFIENDIDLIINYLYVHETDQNSEKNINIELIKKIIFVIKNKNIKKHIYISTNRAFKNTKNEYGKIKLECENLIQQHNTNYNIIRPSTVIKKTKNSYIGGYKGITIKKLLKFINKYKILPIPGNGDYIHTYCFIENLNEFIFFIYKDNSFDKKIINFYSGEKLTFVQFLFKINNNKKVFFIRIPIILLKFISYFLKSILRINNQINNNFNNLINEEIEYDFNHQIIKIMELKKMV